MARAPLPAGAGGFRTVPATLGPPAQGRGLQALRPMAASAGAFSLRRDISSGLPRPRSPWRSVLFQLLLDRHNGLCATLQVHSPHYQRCHLGCDGASARWVAAAFWLIAFGLAAGA